MLEAIHSAGSALAGRTVQWATSNSAAATVASRGLVTATGAGSTSITATSEGVSGAADITVTLVPVASVEVTPATATLAAPSNLQLTATVRDADGNALAGRQINWTSSNTLVADVSSTGVVTGLSAGSATVTASSEGQSGSAVITVQSSTGSRVGYYVAPGGSSGGDGSAGAPWDLATALAHPAAVQPGDTIWLRGGTYSGSFTSALAGTMGAPIIVRQYPGERATIDGNLVIFGSDTWYWGFEVTNSDPSAPNIMGLNIKAPRTKFVNLIVHEATGNGLGFWIEAQDAEIYGSIIYNNGRRGSAPGRYAHGIYVQNTTGSKRLVDNVVFNSYSYNFHGYTEGGALNNFHLEGNVSFNAGAYVDYGGNEYLVGGGQPVQNLTFTTNYSYAPSNGATNSFGFSADNPAGSRFTDNYFTGLVEMINWQGGTFTGNTLSHVPWQLLYLFISNSQVLSNFTWDNNAYWWPDLNGGGALMLRTAGTGVDHTFDSWRQATGFDGASSYQQGSPTTTEVFVRPNQYEPGRAHVIVYNWSGAGSITVDPSGFLQSGQQYEVRNAQTYFGPPVLSGTYSGGNISLPLTAVTPPPPIGATTRPAESTGTEFHVFVVVPK